MPGAPTFVSPSAPLFSSRRRKVISQKYVVRAVQNVSKVNDDFVLPFPDRLKPREPTKRRSVSQNRLEQKQKELAEKKVDSEEEIRRAQLAEERISTRDLVGILDTTDLSSGTSTSEGVISQGLDTIQQDADFVTPKGETIRASKHHSKKFVSANQPQRERERKDSVKERKSANGVAETQSPFAIQPGQLVIHSRHGIGRFRGVERTRGPVSEYNARDGERPVQEYVVLEYRDGDVYVPMSQFETIRALHADEKQSAKLDSIAGDMMYPGRGNGSRQRRVQHLARTKTRQKIRKQLVNLQALYAQRTTLEREPFPFDVDAEQEFARTCDFELTKDQKVATQHILRDMTESSRPMDRLVCGDVGFGKTEVALRAAFRALKAGKQVAVLAPTTILAKQHYETFCERFSVAYPEYKVACFTRFAKRKDVNEWKEMVARGELQVAIGTHVLLGNTFQFHSLGLLIVDEEHRLGVNQKEKLRARYKGVDTLFLSATPIPRTLHLALSGLRDASVLQTPPVGRKPVITRVVPSGAGVVREAIGKEVRRGGQTFFVVPRIEGIEATANWVRDLFPKLRIVVAHGSTSDLESRVWAFAKGDYDVLLCTTIIENGIDMPNVNTIIVQDAGRFGLAQLHQLRGRVGRSDAQAYAWMLFSAERAGNSVNALDRLKTLEQNSSLGSGFAIAQRDMEMRGVGEVIGVQQHGNNSVPADEYAMMLAEELEHARTGKPIPIRVPNPAHSTEVFLPVASLIPSEYIPDFDEKMKAYESLSKAESRYKLKDVVSKLQAKYGSLPVQAKRHVCILDLKLMSKALGISRIFTERQHVLLDWPIGGEAFKRLVAFLPDKQARNRCELRESEERVVMRGLGICSGDVQIAKLRSYFQVFIKAAEGLREQSKQADATLSQSLSALANDNTR